MYCQPTTCSLARRDDKSSMPIHETPLQAEGYSTVISAANARSHSRIPHNRRGGHDGKDTVGMNVKFREYQRRRGIARPSLKARPGLLFPLLLWVKLQVDKTLNVGAATGRFSCVRICFNKPLTGTRFRVASGCFNANGLTTLWCSGVNG